MYWTSGLVLVALTIGQVPASLVEPEAFKENAFNKVMPSIGSDREVYQELPTGGHPHVAFLRGVRPVGTIQNNCAGTIVHRNWVLTNAACTNNCVSVVVRVGVNDFTTIPDYIFESTEWYVHPRYASTTRQNDISIISLKQRPLTFSSLVQPIRIQPAVNATADYDNVLGIANGLRWTDGASPEVIRYWANFRAISNVECRGVLGSTAVTNIIVCARWHGISSQFTCSQSQLTGGSLWHLDGDGVPVLIGINSMWQNIMCNDAFRLAAFTRPGSYHPWLTEITGLDFENLNQDDEVTEAP